MPNHLPVRKYSALPHLSVVIPVYQAEQCLNELFERLVGSLNEITTFWEIILVDDYSKDNSWQLLKKFAREKENVRCLKLSRNFGQHNALTAGLDCARGDWVVTMDCDLQDRPEDINLLYQRAQEGVDVVLARRVNRTDSLLKKISNKLFYALFNFLSDMKYNSEVGGFKIISRRVTDNLLRMREQVRFINGFVQWLGFPTAYVIVTHEQRFAGNTSYSFIKLLRLALDIILAYSDKPLKIFVKFGFVVSSFAFVVGMYFLFNTLLFGAETSGWTSLIVSLYFLSGAIITSIGVTGLYVGKIFEESKGRPLYVVEQQIGFPNEEMK